jgi:hypothetical protein
LQNVLGAGLSLGGLGAPPALPLMMIFPYTSGLKFAHTLLRNGGYGEIDSTFLNPPVSTEQVLHPEKFLNREGFKKFSIEQIEQTVRSECPDCKLIHSDRLGEFMVNMVATSVGVPSEKVPQVGAGWNGDLVAVFRESGDKYLVTWQTSWDSAQDATIFEEEIISRLKNKPGLKVDLRSQDNDHTLFIKISPPHPHKNDNKQALPTATSAQ